MRNLRMISPGVQVHHLLLLGAILAIVLPAEGDCAVVD